MVAEVIINSTVKTLNRVFDYSIPKELEDRIYIGSRVLVPFGKGEKTVDGFVVSIKEKSEYEVKNITSLKSEELTDEKIEFAKWMAKRYFCNVSDCIKLMLPPGRVGIKNKVKEKNINVVYLNRSIDEIKDEIETNIIKSEKQKRILNFLINNDGITVQELEMYTDTTKTVIKTLEKNGFIEIVSQQVERNPLINKKVLQTNKLEFNDEQEYAYNKICENIDKSEFEEYLLYGITGSGKTEIYMQLIEKVIRKNKSAIVLVPEISLTPQMIDRFISRFGEETISVLHSKLSIGERYDSWQNIKDGKTKVIIGARSAIFAPVNNLGIIIIDEEHDNSYKSEMNPRYNAKEIAEKMAKELNIPLLLGSATPDINTFYRANIGEMELLKLTKRANNSILPDVKIIDLRQELANGNRSMISMELYKSIKENIKNKKQTILFLNRRGFSTFVMCRDCGYTLKCKNCNISLTYHKKEEKMKCHYCGYQEDIVQICPNCGSKKIKYFGTGTQKLETEIKKIFPEATTIRMDVDTVNKKNSHEEILNKFKNENIDILIGTQMIVKGHHFPNVTLVGIIAADSSLNIDDYRAEERTFDIIVQVAGRAGREKEKGKVIVQTYNTDNYSIMCAKKQDYDLFYSSEIKIRKQLKYPPFCDIIMIGITGENEKEVINISNNIYNLLQKEFIKINIDSNNIIKPLPAPIDKIKNRFRWRIIIKSKATNELINVLNNILSKHYYENKNTKARIIVDINPMNLM